MGSKPEKSVTCETINEDKVKERTRDDIFDRIVQICERLEGELPDDEYRDQTREIQNLAKRMHFLSGKSKELAERTLSLLHEDMPIMALQAILGEAIELVCAQRGQILIWVPEDNQFDRIQLPHTEPIKGKLVNQVIDELARKALEFNSPILNPEIDAFTEIREIAGIENFPALSIIVTPLVIETEDKCENIGILYLDVAIKDRIFTETDLWFIQFLASLSALSIRNIRLTAALRLAYMETVQALVMALEAKDQFTRGHSQRVAQYAERCGQRFNLKRPQLHVLYSAALLHDVGKIGMRESVLYKPLKLTQEAYEYVKKHVEISEGIIRGLSFLTEESKILVQFHERFDGEGYPQGLKGDEIILESAIIQVVDEWDSLTSREIYEHDVDIRAALKKLKSKSGSQFNPEVVEIFAAMIEEDGVLPIDDTETDISLDV